MTRRKTAIVILEDEAGRVALQLRDNIPTIQSPNMWGLFGGAVEDGESVLAAARREVLEELDLEMDEERLQVWRSFVYAHHPKRLHVFWYGLTSAEKAALHLNEGQRYAFVTPAAVTAGTIDGHKVNAIHQDFIRLYYERPNSY